MFQLTSQERKVIIFVLSILMLGLGLDFFRKKTHRLNFVNYDSLQQQLLNKVDVNKATFRELADIPGVGENLAYLIIEYRKSRGNFKTIEELKNVKGIKDKKLEKIRKYVTIKPVSKSNP